MKRMLIRTIIAVAILIPIALVFACVNIYLGIDDTYAQWGAADTLFVYGLFKKGALQNN